MRATRRCWSTSTAGPSAIASATTATASPHRRSLRPRTVVEGALHPRWAWGLLPNDAIAFPNLDGTIPKGRWPVIPECGAPCSPGPTSRRIGTTSSDLRQRWAGPIILKGCVNAERRRPSRPSIGIDAIQVSNHGGRQLDHMASPLDVLPEIVERTAGRVEIIVDGGIRRGSDIVKALALGADACAIGRPYLYGLAAAGQAGVAHVLQPARRGNDPNHDAAGCFQHQGAAGEGSGLIRHRADFSRAPHQPSRRRRGGSGMHDRS